MTTMMNNGQAPDAPETVDFGETLRIVGDTRRRLPHRELRSLSDIGREHEEAFLQTWRSIDLDRRREIVRAMVDLAEENVDVDFRDVFTACLGDADADVREAAVEGLWDDDRPRTMRQFLRLLASDPDDDVRAASALALGRFAYRASLDELAERDTAQLRKALVDGGADLNLPVEVRRRALEGAGYFAGADVDQAIAGAYASGVSELKQSALAAIGHTLDSRWLPVLQAELASTEPALRYEAAHASGEWGEEAASLVPLLLPLAESDDPEVYNAALWALGQIGGDAARRTLRRLAQSEESGRQAAAEEALSELDFDADPFRLI
jgi:HEAT repeat protein